MKITNDQYLEALKQQEQSRAKKTQPGADFGEMLSREVDKSSGSGAQPLAAPPPGAKAYGAAALFNVEGVAPVTNQNSSERDVMNAIDSLLKMGKLCREPGGARRCAGAEASLRGIGGHLRPGQFAEEGEPRHGPGAPRPQVHAGRDRDHDRDRKIQVQPRRLPRLAVIARDCGGRVVGPDSDRARSQPLADSGPISGSLPFLGGLCFVDVAASLLAREVGLFS